MKKLTEKQRTAIALAIIIALIAAALIVFWIASARNVEYIYIQHVDENGFADYVDGELVYFHYPNASEEFRVCNTVRVAWWKSSEINEPYDYINEITGTSQTASVRVSRVSARKTIPWLGEPLYG